MGGKRQTVLQGQHVKKKWKKKQKTAENKRFVRQAEKHDSFYFLTWKSSAGAAVNLDGLHLSVLAIDAHNHHPQSPPA